MGVILESNGWLKELLESIDNRLTSIDQKIDKQNDRIRKVEINQAKIMGGAIFIAFVISILTKVLF